MSEFIVGKSVYMFELKKKVFHQRKYIQQEKQIK